MNIESDSIVVTGLGVVSATGLNTEQFWNSMLAGKGGYSQVTAFDLSGQRTTVGCEIQNFDENSVITAGLQVGGRATRMAVTAAAEALAQAELHPDVLQKKRVGVSLGTTMGEIRVLENFMDTELGKGKADRSLLRHYPCAVIPLGLAEFFNIQGPNLMIPTACAAGNFAIGAGRDLLLRGKADFMIVGGVDPYSRVAHTGFNRLFSVSPDLCRPFDAHRRGLVIGEGAGILILETEKSARNRGVKILAKVLGYGLSNDAFHITKPLVDGSGLLKAMNRALKMSDRKPEDIDYICAHGTGTPANDAGETMGIKRLLGPRAYRTPVSSIKSMIGHAMGAASALEAVACVMALNTGMLPPTTNYQTPDSECDLDYVPNQSRKVDVNLVMSNSMAFGGNNSSLILERVSHE